MITEENYFEDKTHFSNSQIKNWDMCLDVGCEARELAIEQGIFPKKDKEGIALVLGHAFDTYWQGKDVHEQFLSEHPELFYKSGANKGEQKEDLKKIYKMTKALEKQDAIMEIINDKDTEFEKIITCELEGHKIKAKIDLYNEKLLKIIDFKTIGAYNGRTQQWSTINSCYVEWYDYWGYLDQISLYKAVSKNVTGKDFHGSIIGVTKEEYPEIFWIGSRCNSNEMSAQIKTDELIMKMDRIKELRDGLDEPVRCERCAYCKHTKVVSCVEL